MSKKYYSSPIGMTQQFRFCGNPFRVDLYKGCDFGCKYCFSNSSVAFGHVGPHLIAKFSTIERKFQRAFDENEDTKSVTVELLQKRVPLHCGGMSDPFQKKEFDLKLTYKLIELSNKYDYPIIFSTKCAYLPDEYFEILDPSRHAFQVSIMGWNDEFIRKYESNTPTAKERLSFVRKLRELGFWVSIRIQPLVRLSEALELIQNAGEIPSFYTVEHLKIPVDNLKVKLLFKEEYADNRFYKATNNFRNIELEQSQKRKNIEEVKKLANSFGIKVGVGDNDSHHLSQCRNCCGVDTIPGDKFGGWLKYNLTNFITGSVSTEDLYIPRCNCRDCFFSEAHSEPFISFEHATKKYICNNRQLVPDEFRKQVSDITGIGFSFKLF